MWYNSCTCRENYESIISEVGPACVHVTWPHAYKYLIYSSSLEFESVEQRKDIDYTHAEFQGCNVNLTPSSPRCKYNSIGRHEAHNILKRYRHSWLWQVTVHTCIRTYASHVNRPPIQCIVLMCTAAKYPLHCWTIIWIIIMTKCIRFNCHYQYGTVQSSNLDAVVRMFGLPCVEVWMIADYAEHFV